MGLKLAGRLKTCFGDSRRKQYVMFILTFLILSFLNHKYITQNLNFPQWIFIEIKTENPIQIEIYYDIGEGYSERDKRIQEVPENSDFQKVKIRLPRKIIHSFRVDPLTTPGIVYIKSITIESLFGGYYRWQTGEIVKDFRPQNDISNFMMEGDQLKVESIGIDPYFGCVVAVPIINQIGNGWVILILFAFSLVCLFFYEMVLSIKERWQTMGYPTMSRIIKRSFIIIGTLLPILIAFYFVKNNGLNIPFYDQWEFVPLWSAYLEGKPWAYYLFESHNGHRMIFPRLIFLIAAIITKWNVMAEMYINLFFITILFLIAVFLLKRTEMPLFLSVPIAWILFSLNQYENLLWGWQMAIFIMTAGVFTSIFFLDQVKRHAAFIIPSILSASIASFSFLSGLVIWPIGFFQLIFMRQKKTILMTWLISSCLMIGLYFLGPLKYADPSFRPDYVAFLKNPFEYIKYVLAYIGSIVGGGHLKQSILYGSATLFIFLTLYFIHMFRGEKRNILPWVMVGVFSLVSGLMTGVGRLAMGIDQALESRYVSISLFFTIATFIVIVNFITGVNQKKGNGQKSVRMILIIISMILIIGYVESYIYGWRGGYQGKLFVKQVSRSLYNLSNATDRELKMIYWDVGILKERAQLLKRLKTGPYAYESNSLKK